MISCVVLAAGESQRMGLKNKLLISIEGSPLIRRTMKEVAKFPFQETAIVTGYEADLITPEIISFDAHIAHNPNYKSGLFSSIRAGLNAVSQDCEGVVFVHADRPMFHVEVIQKLAMIFHKTDGPRILYPRFQGRRGQPTLVSSDFFEEIRGEIDGDYDLDFLMRRHPAAVLPIDVNDDGVLEDLNVPEDAEELQLIVV